jgi:beta-glucosidase/6-phospho-beta-glucosidase/beta-galactosidase
MTDLGSAPPLEVNRGFVVATGIECSAPLVNGRRVDELVKTGHVERFREDFALAAGLGVRYLRYGIPFHRVNPEPARLDWSWVDAALAACRESGLIPIVDLMHFGVPDDLRDYQNPALVDRFGTYVRTFVERYPWARYFTPVNEPFITAAFSARDGLWNEQRKDQRAFARALINVARCVVVGAAEIRRARPDAVLIQAETCQYTHPADEAAVDHARLENELRFVTFDLAFGRPLPAVVRGYLIERGIDPDALGWFERHGTDANWIVGNDYYETSELEIDHLGRLRASGVRLGYAALARQYHERFGLPIMHTETNMEGSRARVWLAAQWADVLRLREDGIPIRGFTWYGLVNHVDWDSTLTDDAGRENTCGLVSLDRTPNDVYADFRTLTASNAIAATH